MPDTSRNDQPLTYEGALDLLMGLVDFERSTNSPGHSAFHLERMHLLMDRLGNQQENVPAVHVAGTKGKGSTAAMITSMLAAQGYTVGLYTSPHLHSVTERIRVGLDPISQTDFAALVEQMWPVIKQVGEEEFGGVTYFEAMTAMGFVHFAQIGADYQVLEVGLGGRLDSTNIILPEVSVITSISLDHVATLGDTIELIAFEKAGIVKQDVPVVVAPQKQEAMSVIRGVADDRGAHLVDVASELTWQQESHNAEGQSFKVSGLLNTYDVQTPLIGDHQLENAATAIAAIETLVTNGAMVSKESILNGLQNVSWSARMEVLHHEGKTIVIDGAHNPYSMSRLVPSIRKYFEFDNVLLIFGSLGGHSAQGMLEELEALSPSVIAVRSRHPRSAPSEITAGIVQEHGFPVVFKSETVSGGIRKAVEIAGEHTLILGTGSLAIVAEIIEEIKGVPPEIYSNLTPPPNPGVPRNR